MTLTDAGTVSVVQNVVLESELDNVPNPTLVRVRGIIFSRLGLAAQAAEESIIIAHAIMVVDAKQLAVGVTAMPLPLSSNSEDFLWFGSQILSNQQLTVAATASEPFAASTLMVDSKAMRKITLNQAVVMVSEIVQLDGSAGDVDFAFNFRVLFKK